jgi:hypothetical protein
VLNSTRTFHSVVIATALLLHGSSAAAEDQERIRTGDGRLRVLLNSGRTRSPTMRDVVARFNRTSWLVFLLPGRCPDAAIIGCLLHTVTSFEGAPALRIIISPGNRRPNTVTAVIAHELWHALEVAESGEVFDRDTLLAFFRRVGRSTIDSRRVTAYETMAAERLEVRVRYELSASDAAAKPRRAQN